MDDENNIRKQKFEHLIKNKKKVIIELGPGNKKKYDGSIAIDRVDLSVVDIVADINLGLGFIPDSSVDHIFSSHFLEHVDDLEQIFREFQRILKINGKIVSIVPHFSSPYFYSDYTHSSFWGLYTPFYFSKESFFKRKVPNFYSSINFEILDIKLHFYSPFYFRNIVKRVVQKLVNSTRYTQELYEEIFTYLFPASELKVIMKKKTII